MKKLIISLALGLFSINSFGFEIFALGTSNTNCKGAGQAYTNALNDMLAQEKINAQVINAGVDGDRPQFMMLRLEQGLKAYPDAKIVIFEPGPNERNKSFNLEASDEILKYLQALKMPTVYVSHGAIESNDEAEQRAKKYGAYYYGHWIKNVPVDRDHRQFDMNGNSGGHMTVAGCQLWAKNMLPFIKQVIKEANIK
jgi:thiamine pyrophosphate-dependent acetolactate synthase large subunit-like protein